MSTSVLYHTFGVSGVQYKKVLFWTRRSSMEMFIEQTIELSGFEARRAMTESIRNKEQKFMTLFNEREKLKNEVTNLSKTSQIRIDDNWRDDPEMLPPEIYQNKVTIYLVLT